VILFTPNHVEMIKAGETGGAISPATRRATATAATI